MPPIPSFANPVIKGISDVLADELTNRQLDSLFAEHGFTEGDQGSNKTLRLYNAITHRQQLDSCGNALAALIHTVMHPAAYTANRECFESRRVNLNKVLGFAGYELGNDGLLRNSKPTITLDEAESRCNALRKKLLDRNVHGDVLAACRTELLKDGNYFHAVLEVSKGIAKKIRDKTGSVLDGTALVDQTMTTGKIRTYPLLAINSYRTESEQNEQSGFANMIRGFFSAFRNPTAHTPKSSWSLPEEDALDVLVFASMLHRKLDKAVKTP